MTLNDYLHLRAGNEPDVMIIHGTPRTVYRDYKGRGVLVAVGPDTYDVVRATTETDIETLYTQGDYQRWRWDGKEVHRVEVEPVVTAGPVVDPNDTRTTAHRLTVTPETMRRAEALGFVPVGDDVLLWALREVDRLQFAVSEFKKWSQAGPNGCPPYSSSLAGYLRQLDASFAALRDIEDRIREDRNEAEAERDAARRDLARIVQLCGWDCDGNDPESPAGAIHLYADAVQAVRELVEERAEDSREIVKLRDLCSRASGMIDTVDGAAYILSERLRVAGGD